MAVMTGTDRKLLIGGEWVEGGDGGYEIVNPATEETVGIAPEASVQQSLDAARAAREVFESWSRTTVEERAALLEAAGKLLKERLDDFVPLVIAETGCTATVGRAMQVPVAASRFDRYALGALEPNVIPLAPQEMPATPLAPGGLIGAMARRAPVGVVACISPYNFPIVNTAGKIGPALAMGNTVVVRPASQDPLAVIELVRVLDEVGFPPGVVNIVTGSTPASGEALVESPDVDMISFTGSTAVGLRIAEVGGRTMKRLLLELGGKGAAIVFDDADLKTAITAIGSVWMFHSGQICTAPTRVLAHRSVVDEVVDRLAAHAEKLKVGDPREPDTVVGPVITAAHRDRIEAYVAGAAADGARVVVGGERPQVGDDGPRGFFVAPTLIADCRADMAAVREEIFGPVVVVVAFDGDDDEAVALANSTSFGLYDYVFSADSARALAFAKRLRSGNVGINTAQRNHEAAFGGFKQSGVGRDGGSWGLHAYSEMQSIMWAG
jgi:phenylacetaldehyde dehydrogenase